ncbi:hypothetical protein NDU88_006030 [Pleurodeles waltl]|uniref:Uncharacterized protein n=1 Tax=Pleurodeles waltl TaxID=8319 RepID=A0AAV7SNM7_PLEWA|nr:hypothetical protein NDU88_006030 [Pleurodeles waltl]
MRGPSSGQETTPRMVPKWKSCEENGNVPAARQRNASNRSLRTQLQAKQQQEQAKKKGATYLKTEQGRERKGGRRVGPVIRWWKIKLLVGERLRQGGTGNRKKEEPAAAPIEANESL